MAQTYGDAVRCEAVRDDVFEGKKSPMIFGQPDQWLALLIESLLRRGPRRARAIAAAAIPGLRRSPDVDRRHRWAAVRLDFRRRFATGPGARSGHQRPLLLGALLPAEQDRARTAGRPARHGLDAGAPAVRERRRVGGADSDPLSRVGRRPTDGLIALARKTVWEEIAPDTHRGLGQRILATDTDDVPLLEVRTISLTGSAEETTDLADDHG